MDERFNFDEDEHFEGVSDLYRQYAEKSELENKLDEMLKDDDDENNNENISDENQLTLDEVENENDEKEENDFEVNKAVEILNEEKEIETDEDNEKLFEEVSNKLNEDDSKSENKKEPNGNSANLVTFKGSKRGLELFINDDPEISFDKIIEDLHTKLDRIKYVYDGIRCGIVLKGRQLSKKEENKIVVELRRNMYMSIDYINTSDFYSDEVKKSQDKKKDYAHTMYYHGTLRSGQSLTSDSSVVIFGDVNPGSEVVAGGNLIVMGSLRGIVQAGQRSNDAYIVAFDMNPKQLRIGDHIARAADDGDDERIKKPHIAYVEDEQICIEPIEGTFNLIEKEC